MAVAPPRDGEEEVAHRAQRGLDGVEEMLSDGADLGGRLGGGERGEIQGRIGIRIRARPGLFGQRVLAEELCGVPAGPAQQILARGDSEVRGGYLLGGPADVVVQLEVGVQGWLLCSGR